MPKPVDKPTPAEFFKALQGVMLCAPDNVPVMAVLLLPNGEVETVGSIDADYSLAMANTFLDIADVLATVAHNHMGDVH